MYVFLFLFLILQLLGLSSEQACSTLPISVSSLNICEDNSCRTSETAQLRLGLIKGSTSCVRVESTGSQVLPSLFNISIVDSVLSYPLVNCYFSDDPQIDLEGFCGCPGGTSVSCDNCPNANPSGDTIICSTGLHEANGCVLGGGGKWCVKLGFQGINRYKICELADPVLKVSISFFDTVENKEKTMTNPTLVTINNNVFNLTLTNPVVRDKVRQEFMIWDMNQDTNFFLVPHRYVNFDNTYDPNLLGWFKSNRSQQTTNKFFESTNIQVQKCSQNTFEMGTSAVYFADFLTTHPDLCAQRVAPGAILRDPDFGLISSMTGESIETPVQLVEGKYFETINGNIIPVGIDSNGAAYPQPEWRANGWTILTNLGIVTSDFMCSNGTHIWSSNTQVLNIIVCQEVNNNPVWAPCIVSTNITGGDITYTCVNINFMARDWPSGTPQLWAFNGTFIQLTNQIPNSIEGSDQIIIPIKDGNIDVLLEFKNITYTFDTINAVPHIDSIDENGDDIVIVASSKTVPGTCVLMISDDLGPTMSIFLALVNNKYRMPITRKKFDDFAIITIQCFKQTDSVSFKITVDKGEPDVIERTINSTSVREASSSDPSTWNAFVKSVSKTFVGLGTLMSGLFNLTGNKIGSFFLGSFIFIMIIIGAPFILYLIWKFLRYFYHMIRNRKVRILNANQFVKVKQN